jgi:FAD/FMN-containing dehydrogenase
MIGRSGPEMNAGEGRTGHGGPRFNGRVTGRASPSLPLLTDPVVAGFAVTDPDLLAGHVRDWTGRHLGSSPAMLRPSTVAEVAACLRACHRTATAIVPQGGNTGLVAGATPLGGEVLLHLGRLVGVEDADADAGTLVVRSGTSLAEVQAAALGIGWEYGVDLAARDSATIGGTVATNAGGLHVVRHGDTRAQLLGVEAVLADGTVVGDLRGLRKDNTGYHLPGLLAGSEGTLAVVTRVALRLVTPAPDRAVALLALDGVAAAVRAAGALRRSLPDLSAVELLLADGLALVQRTHGLAPPFAGPVPAVLLVEVAGAPGVVERLGAVVDGLEAVTDAVVAGDPVRRAALWRYREAQTEAIARVGVAHKLDVTLPASRLAAFAESVRADVLGRWPDAAVWLFGHAGDGNVHVNVTGVPPDEAGVDDLVLRRVAAMGGSISAEHGIGRAKVRWLHLNRTGAELTAMRRIKLALDPLGILNPGALLPPL